MVSTTISTGISSSTTASWEGSALEIRITKENELNLASTTPHRAAKRYRSDGDHGIKVLRNKHLKLIHEIGSGPGYFLHAAQIKHRAVIVKVFNSGPRARDLLESTIALAQRLMHPNVLRITGVSAPASINHFIAYEDVHWKNAEGPLAAALKQDLIRSISLGFKMISGLSSGINHLGVHGISVRSLTVENCHVFVDISDRFLICSDPETYVEEEGQDNNDSSWDIFNALCEKVLRRANGILHNENINRNPSLVESFQRSLQNDTVPSSVTPGASPVPLAGLVEPRREYVWRRTDHGQQTLATVAHALTLDLDINLSSIKKFSWSDGKSPHRCNGYAREEITLTTTARECVVVSHGVPSPLEICSICHELVDPSEMFRCICGDPHPGLHDTIRCSSCRYWSHSCCAGDRKKFFICELCSRQENSSSSPSSTDIDSLSNIQEDEDTYEKEQRGNIFQTGFDGIYPPICSLFPTSHFPVPPRAELPLKPDCSIVSFDYTKSQELPEEDPNRFPVSTRKFNRRSASARVPYFTPSESTAPFYPAAQFGEGSWEASSTDEDLLAAMEVLKSRMWWGNIMVSE
ncbi:hypothetical protein C8R43DRAFT_675942 [Mycena crocata]|nr:hypothetical protein C8R43DRAFT_675942 [Mycena crocata]